MKRRKSLLNIDTTLQSHAVSADAYPLSWRWKILIVVTLAIFCLIYGRTILFGLVWDDWFLFRHYSPKELVSKLWGNWTMGTWQSALYYRPFAIWSMAVDVLVWRQNFSLYHLQSLLIGFANALGVLGLAARLGNSRLAGCIAAITFIVLPYNAYSVTWLAQRTDLLATFFALISAYLLVAGSLSRNTTWLLLSSALTYGGALLSKETAYPLVFLFVICAMWRVVSERPYTSRSIGILPFGSVAVAVGYTCLRLAMFQGIGGGSSFLDTLPIPLKVAGFVFHYLQAVIYLFVPLPLVFEVTDALWLTLYAGSIIALLGLAMRLKSISSVDQRLDVLLRFGLLWIVVMAMALFRSSEVRSLYLTSVGLAFMVAAALAKLLNSRTARLSSSATIGALLVVLLFAVSVKMNYAVQDLFAPGSPFVVNRALDVWRSPDLAPEARQSLTVELMRQGVIDHEGNMIRDYTGRDSYLQNLWFDELIIHAVDRFRKP